MKTKVITLENVKVCYRIPNQKLRRELLDGLGILVGFSCMVLSVFIFGLLLYAYA